MNVKIAAAKTDDPSFVELLNRIVQGLVVRSRTAEVHLVQIDNWFDHKWLRFSGIGSVDFRFPAFMNRYDAAKDEFYQDRVTFPPFSPNRVLSEHRFVWRDGVYTSAPRLKLLYGKQRQRSELNLHKRVTSVLRSACVVWYSSNTVVNDRASMMVYTVMTGDVHTWFAAFMRTNEWRLLETKGTKRDDVLSLMMPIRSESRPKVVR